MTATRPIQASAPPSRMRSTSGAAPRRRQSAASRTRPAQTAARGAIRARPSTSSISPGGEPEPSRAIAAPVVASPVEIRSGRNQAAGMQRAPAMTGIRRPRFAARRRARRRRARRARPRAGSGMPQGQGRAQGGYGREARAATAPSTSDTRSGSVRPPENWRADGVKASWVSAIERRGQRRAGDRPRRGSRRPASERATHRARAPQASRRGRRRARRRARHRRAARAGRRSPPAAA